MAYTVNTLQTVRNGPNNFSVWMYRTADTIAVVTAAGYFNSAAGNLNDGDVVVVVASNGSEMLQIASTSTRSLSTVRLA